MVLSFPSIYLLITVGVWEYVHVCHNACVEVRGQLLSRLGLWLVIRPSGKHLNPLRILPA